MTAVPDLQLTPLQTLPNRPLRVGILGATGAVGQELLELLAERAFPVAQLVALASSRSAGRSLAWGGGSR